MRRRRRSHTLSNGPGSRPTTSTSPHKARPRMPPAHPFSSVAVHSPVCKSHRCTTPHLQPLAPMWLHPETLPNLEPLSPPRARCSSTDGAHDGAPRSSASESTGPRSTAPRRGAITCAASRYGPSKHRARVLSRGSGGSKFGSGGSRTRKRTISSCSPRDGVLDVVRATTVASRNTSKAVTRTDERLPVSRTGRSYSLWSIR